MRAWVSMMGLTALVFLVHVGEAHALYVSSKAYLHSAAFTTSPVTDGGPDETTASVSDSGSFGGSDSTSTVTASATASSGAGHSVLDLSMFTTVSPEAPGDRASTFVIGRAEATDWVHVSAGTSGLANGTPVTVELQVELDGFVSLNGIRSSHGEYVFKVSARYTPGQQVEVVESLDAPVEYTVGPNRWYVTIDTTIGGSIILDTWLEAQISPQIYPPDEEKTDEMRFDADFRITQSDAFPDIGLTTEAGAPTDPLPPLVPVLGTPGRVVLVLALLGTLGVAAVMTRERYVTRGA